jgi:diadenylate cyclase
MRNIAEAFVTMFTQSSGWGWISYLLEFIAFFMLMYYVCKVLKENNAGRLVALYSVLIVVSAIWAIFFYAATENKAAVWVFMALVLLLSFFMLLLFSVEIKRSIWAKKNALAPVKPDKSIAVTKPETEACIEGIIRACQNMSKNDIGALIVLSNGNLPKQIVESGTIINADISQQMIEGIFFPKAPLHDGALVIQEHKLLAAGCFLPLTQNNEKYSKDLGTRHRAGIGITEVTNVVSIIVSEETGIISIVKQGKITRNADYNMLRKELETYYWKDFAADNRKKKTHAVTKQ